MNKNKDEILEEREITGNKKKLLLWGSLALVLIILTAALLLIFLLPKETKYYIRTESGLEVVLEGQGEYTEGEEVTIKAEDIEGYIFRNWTLNGIEVSKDLEYTFKVSDETDGTYRANYDKLFKITIANIENGSILTDKTEAIEGEEVEIEVSPNVEYMLGEIYYIVEGTSVRVDIVDNKFEMPLGNITIYGNFEQVKYELELGSNITDVELIGEGKYTLGEKVTIKASEKEGYRFRNWTLNGEEVSRTPEFLYQINKSENVTLIANYDKLFKILIAQSDYCEIKINKLEAIEGENVEIDIIIKKDNYVLNELYYLINQEKHQIKLEDGKYIMTMPNQNITLVATCNEVTIDSVVGSYRIYQSIWYSGDDIVKIINCEDLLEEQQATYVRVYDNNTLDGASCLNVLGDKEYSIYTNISFTLEGTVLKFVDDSFMGFFKEIHLLDNSTMTFEMSENGEKLIHILTRVENEKTPVGVYKGKLDDEGVEEISFDFSEDQVIIGGFLLFNDIYNFGNALIINNEQLTCVIEFSFIGENLKVFCLIYDKNSDSYQDIPEMILYKE